jgi:UDP:flavonoid glycosyltransferase YjiC (YdhE family)
LIPQIPYHNKRILVCPLDWGLGHAARCVPLIRQLQAQQNYIVAGCTGWQRSFLESELSNVAYTELFGYNVTYSKYTPLALKMLWQFPRLSYIARKEHNWLEEFVTENKIDVVISDNRYGLYTDKAESVFITHQLRIPSPLLNETVNKLNWSFIRKFGHCWVPDFAKEESSLAGMLSHGETPVRATYIGPLSRFARPAIVPPAEIDVLLLLSGVEPQRSLLEEKLCEALQDCALNICLVRGTSAPMPRPAPAHFKVIDVCPAAELQERLLRSRSIICRAGYSTLMDLHALGLKAILVPTPGQAEQEYLSDLWERKHGCKVMPQKTVSRSTILAALEEKTPSLQK